MTAFLTTNEPALVKTTAICKSSFRSAGGRPNRSPASPPARLEQPVSSNRPVPDIRAAHADVHWRSDRTRNQIHRQANEAPQSTRRALPRAPQAKSRAPWQTPFRKRKSPYRMLAARVSRKNQTLSTSAGKVQFAGISMSHERKTHAKRRSKMKFNFRRLLCKT